MKIRIGAGFHGGAGDTITTIMVDEKIKQAYEEAQRGLVSNLLYIPEGLGKAMSSLDAEDFSDGVARTIFETMVEIEREGKHECIDYPHVLNRLVQNGKLPDAGGLETLQQYFQDGASHGTSGAVSSYVLTIKNVASKLRISQLSSELGKMVDEPTNPSDSVIRYGRKVLDDEMLSLSNSQDSIEFKEYFAKKDGGYLGKLQSKVKHFRESKKRGDNPLKATGGIPSSFGKINEATGGWLPGQLNVVGARTGVGKSFFLVDEAVKACESDVSVLMFSLEMLQDELMDRIICAYSMSSRGRGVTLSKLKKGDLSPKDLEGIEALQDEISKFNLTIDTTPSISLDHIRAKAKQMASSQTGLGLIIIDYLQLVQPPKGERSNRERQVADISRGLKLLAMELQVPVIVAAQLNRVNKDDADPTPTINDLRESNAIAQDASVIILIHRDTSRNADGGYDPATFIIGKNRNGQSGIRFRCTTALNMASFLETKDGVDDFEDDTPDASQAADAPTSGETHEVMGDFDIDSDDDDDVFGGSNGSSGDDDVAVEYEVEDDASTDDPWYGGGASTAVGDGEEDDIDEEW